MPRLRRNTVTRKLASGEVKTYHYAAGSSLEPEKQPTMADLIVAYKKHSAWTKLAPESHKTYGHALSKIDSLRPLPLSMIDADQIEIIRESLADTPAMGNITLALLQSMFKVGRKLKMVATNPVKEIERFDLGKGEPWPMWAVEHFREKCSDEWLFRFDLILLSCQRRGDIVRARWNAYDGVGVAFHQQKTGVLAYVPLPQIVDQLNARRTAAKGLTIIADAQGRPYTPDTFSASWHAELKRIGLGRKRLTMHGLRHTGLTMMADNGASEHQLAAVSGHQNLAEVREYTKRANQRKLAAHAVTLLPMLAKRQNTGA